MLPNRKRFLSICNLIKQFPNQPVPFSITPTRSGQHGASGAAARALMVMENKRASVRVLHLEMANAVGE